MRAEILTLALMVGACTWAFRALPLLMNPERLTSRPLIARLLAATGPAAIATLFVASVLPMLRAGVAPLALTTGTLAVLAVWFWRRSVVLATLGGAAAYGLAFALTP